MNISDIGEAVRETSMLADVTISMWSAERTDAALLQKIKDDAGATGNVGRVVKNMLAGADAPLKDTRSAFNDVRVAHYRLTLPWTADPHSERSRGPRLLPNALWDTYLGDVTAARTKAYAVRDVFLDEYPALVERAKLNLGELAKNIVYPTVEELRAQFRIVIELDPIPDRASFKGLPTQTLEKLGDALVRKQAVMVQAAQTAMWVTCKDRLTHLRDRLGDPEAMFHATTVEKVRELVKLMAAWNITKDIRAVEVVAWIDELLSGIKPDDLRNDETMRERVYTDTCRILTAINQWSV